MKSCIVCKIFGHKWIRDEKLDEYSDSPLGYYKKKLKTGYKCKRCGEVNKINEKV